MEQFGAKLGAAVSSALARRLTRRGRFDMLTGVAAARAAVKPKIDILLMFAEVMAVAAKSPLTERVGG
jgi:hypothetical protein